MIKTLALVLTLVFATNIQKSAPICKILEDPSLYKSKNITIRGKVVSSYHLLGASYYNIEDKYGCEIQILSASIAPEEKRYVKVMGKVHELYKWGENKGVYIIEKYYKYE